MDEHPAYLSQQILTCIGNKRALLGVLGRAVDRVKERLGRDRLDMMDAFSGSGIVSRLFKSHAHRLVSNDLEDYAAVLGRCFLADRSQVDLARIASLARALNDRVLEAPRPEGRGGEVGEAPGFIEELYSPADEEHITPEDRVFYTRDNARRLDRYRRLLGEVPLPDRDLLLGPLLVEASIHANTAGVFKGFYKDRATGRGRFGGTHGDALARIRGPITLEAPVLSRFSCQVQVLQQDAEEAVAAAGPLDLLYLDPPYNQHPYGSNYFMLNLLVHYRRPVRTSRVSGIPTDWRRSDFNSRTRCLPALRRVLERSQARFVLLSFNDEGFLGRETLLHLLSQVGPCEVVDTPHPTFRGSRNLRSRSPSVTEQLFLVERR